VLTPSYTRPVSRPNGHRSPIASLDHIAELAQTLAPLLEDVDDAGARKSGGIEFVGRGKGFTDADPTGTAALDPTRRQMRAAVRRAAALIFRAEDELTEAGSVIANGYLRLDREEWIRVWRSARRRSHPLPQGLPHLLAETVQLATTSTTRMAASAHFRTLQDSGCRGAPCTGMG
jgi:hypothetical protein